MSQTTEKELIKTELDILENFKNIRVRHLKLDEVVNQLKQIEYPSFAEKIVTLVGPSGAGKSTVLKYAEALINKKYFNEMTLDVNFIPVVRTELQTGLTGDFNWKDAFIRLLEAFNEPLIRKKIITKHFVELNDEVVTNLRSLVGAELRRAFRNCIVMRNTKVLLLDEASCLFVASTGSNYLLQFELVKSLVNDLKTRIVLCGAFDLMKIEDFNGQLIRRTRTIYFDRYHLKELLERNKYGDAFRDVVKNLLDAIPIEKEADLCEHYEYYLMMSLGCVGNLKDWFARALEVALHSENSILTREIIKATELPVRQLAKMLKEIKLGEAKMIDDSRDSFARDMGFSEMPSLTIKKKKLPESPNCAETTAPKKRRIGSRSPSRDVVGGAYL